MQSDRKKTAFTLSEGCDASSAASGSSGIGFATIPSSPATTAEASRSSQSVKPIFLQSLIGNPRAKKILQHMVDKKTLPPTILFYGPEGVGKGLFALELA